MESDTGYITYQTDAAIQKILAMTTGSTFPSIDAKTLRGIVLAFPSRDEQAAIAQVLTGMDAEIIALEAKLTKARQIKQGMMQQLLIGQIRLVSPESNTEGKS